MDHAFTCTCKTLFGSYVKDGQPNEATCPCCGETVRNGTSMHRGRVNRHHNIISDIADFRSPVDGSVVGSRAALREHNKRNDVVQMGNDKVTPQDNAPMTRAGYDIKRAIETARG